ncbi:hypothetical protein [Streptomyces sp. NBC_01727]|uniref:hypothetical protein n=1 Tax=Streptomyces sp. NBC_01727 TaxID=2975924 RepID=UPI003FA38B5A
MTTCSNRALLLVLSANAVATSLTAATAPAAQAAAAKSGVSVPALTWQPCVQPGGPAGQECADLPVPLDYAHPAGPQLTLAVSRLRSDRPEARHGTLIVIPGGPGGAGVQRLTQKGAALRKEMAGRTTWSASIRRDPTSPRTG